MARQQEMIDKIKELLDPQPVKMMSPRVKTNMPSSTPSSQLFDSVPIVRSPPQNSEVRQSDQMNTDAARSLSPKLDEDKW